MRFFQLFQQAYDLMNIRKIGQNHNLNANVSCKFPQNPVNGNRNSLKFFKVLRITKFYFKLLEILHNVANGHKIKHNNI